jgi:hypothetical protein
MEGGEIDQFDDQALLLLICSSLLAYLMRLGIGPGAYLYSRRVCLREI